MAQNIRLAGPGMASIRELLRGLSADSEWLLTAASVFREPVTFDALPAGNVGPAGLTAQIEACGAAGLVTVDSASQPPTFQVATDIAAELHAHLARADRCAAIARAHRHAANYWQWRVTALGLHWQAGVHDLLEARHHLIEADDLDPAETIAEDVCSRLHAFGAYAQERALISDTLALAAGDSPRRAAWAYRLGKACHLQADDEEAEHWFRQALTGFERLADAHGMARCYGYLGALAHARGDYAEAERCYLKSHALEKSESTARKSQAFQTVEPAADGGVMAARAGSDLPGLAIRRPESDQRHAAGRPAGRGTRTDRRLGRSIAASARRRRVLAVVSAVAAVLAVGTAMAAGLAGHRGAASSDPVPTADPALTAAAATRAEAAAWIAKWAADDAIVACDPLMCSALQAHGLPAARILEIISSTPDPLGSDLVAASAAVRSRFGRRLSAVYAPAVIASFGSASARIDVRVVAANGTAAYRSALRADLAARRLAGSALLGNPRISATAAAVRQLAAGRVDSRLLITLAAVAALRPVAVIAFGGAGPGSDASTPLLSADITAKVVRAGGGPATTGRARAVAARSLAGFVAFLRVQRPPLLAAHISELRLSAGLTVVRIEFSAPSPPGLLVGAADPTKPSAAATPAA